MECVERGKLTTLEAFELLKVPEHKFEEALIAKLQGKGMRALENILEGGDMKKQYSKGPQVGQMTFKEAKERLDPTVRRSAQRLVDAGKTPLCLIVSDVVRKLIPGGRRKYDVACKVGDRIQRFRLDIVTDPNLPADLVVLDKVVKLTKAQRKELDEMEGP